ncbi:hypothetical protein [Amaricoccus sp.]|uniref:hypothetical protein n=1 Tax=Amaricoccus sp. TaxID=1872485 RepID=UPI001B6BBFA6|nr:hypothetical protein [Amaricoccus sp.]MBP7002120.1 hypothetical protein [Amaricoccus sp.]
MVMAWIRRMFNVRGSLISLLVLYAPTAEAATIHASSITGLRDISNEILVLGFQAAKKFPDMEDRTIAHFDVTTLTAAPRFAKLVIPLSNSDPNGEDGALKVYSFAGDGVVSVDEWNSGSLVRKFSHLGQPGRLEVDVTQLVAAALASGDQYLSFAYRAGATYSSGQGFRDRWWFGEVGRLRDSTVVVPVPPAGLLMLTGLLLAGLGATRRSWQAFLMRRRAGDLACS